MKRFLIICIALQSFICFAQTGKQDLLITHYEPGAQQFKQKLFAYHFVNGVYTGREELMQFDGKQNGRDYIRTDKGKNQIYKQRYLITGIGNIIDLKERRVVFDGKAQLVRISNDSAIYYTNDAFKGKFYSVFNFKTMQYGEVKDLLFKAKLGKDVEYDKTVKPFQINYYPQGKPKVLLTTDAGYGQQSIPDTKYIPDPALFWLDNSNFIFANFNQAGTEIKIQKINIESPSIQTIGTVTVGSGNREAFFERLDAETIVLYCGMNELQINVKKNTVVLSTQSKVDHAFSYSLASDAKGRTIFWSGKEIGKLHFDTDNYKVTDNLLATLKMLVIGNEIYQQGLQIWNNATKKWQSIESEEVAAIIGWVEIK
jgi:hypothetical protein